MAGNHGNPGLIRATKRVYVNKWSFLAVFVGVFFVSFSILNAFDFVPETDAKEEVKKPTQVAAASAALRMEYPSRIEIPSLDIDVTVANPTSTNVAVLDEELLKGAVRYPTSAKLGDEGNVIIFGHSSRLPVVHNQSFKAFNEIENLKAGERITVYGNDTAYVYEVDKVYQASATTDAIPLTTSGHTLTLVSCDNFGSKADRFVVTATLVGTYPDAS